MPRNLGSLGGARLEKNLSTSQHSLLYRAFSEELGHPVMIKRLHPKFPPESRTARRFLRGGEIAASLNHPHIVQTYAAGQENGVTYMLMEYLEGHSLHDILKRRGKLNFRIACDIITKCAMALDYAASQRIIHRKIEPSHIMLSPGNRIKLLGFGLAKLMDIEPNAAITAEGALVGIGPYSPPEAGSNKTDIRGDLYSLGAVFYHMLGGRPPFVGTEPLEVLHKHRTEPAWPVRDLAGPELPEEIEAIVMGLLVKDVDKRIQTPRELIAQIDAYMRPDVLGSSPGIPLGGQTLLMSTRQMLAIRNQHTILVCDAQPYVLNTLHESLRRLGMVTLKVHDGKTALEALERENIDLIVTDTRVPGLSGIELMREITRRKPGVPIVLTRGGRSTAGLRHAEHFQIAAALERPVDPTEVRTVIRGLLG